MALRAYEESRKQKINAYFTVFTSQHCTWNFLNGLMGWSVFFCFNGLKMTKCLHMYTSQEGCSIHVNKAFHCTVPWNSEKCCPYVLSGVAGMLWVVVMLLSGCCFQAMKIHKKYNCKRPFRALLHLGLRGGYRGCFWGILETPRNRLSEDITQFWGCCFQNSIR